VKTKTGNKIEWTSLPGLSLIAEELYGEKFLALDAETQSAVKLEAEGRQNADEDRPDFHDEPRVSFAPTSIETVNALLAYYARPGYKGD
jgi:hypothetical protein